MNVYLYYRYPISKIVAKLSIGFIALVFLFILPAYSAPPPHGVSINLPNKTQAQLSFVQNNVIAQLSNGKKLVLVNNISRIPEYARDIWAEDFNFDGIRDVAITTNLDPHTHDQIYSVFIWENGLKQFVPLNFRGGLSNIEVLANRREVRSSYQSGDYWTEDTHRFNQKQPFLYSKSQLIINNIWHTTIYSPQGSPIRSLVSNDGRVDHPPKPVLLTVSSNTAALYRHPQPTSMLPNQLNRGDRVTVLDFKQGSGRLNWVNVRAQKNNQLVQGWVLLSNL